MRTITNEELRKMLDEQTIVHRDEKVTVIRDGEGNTLRICTKCRGRLLNNEECWWCNRHKSENKEHRRKGKWIETINSIGGNLIHDAYECSCCRLDMPYKTKFCPDCGADMRGEE